MIDGMRCAARSTSSNNIGDAGMVAFAHALKPNRMCPTGALSNLAELQLGDINRMGDAGVTALAGAIASGALASLRTLYVPCGPLGTEHPKLKAACEARRIVLP